MPLLSRVADPVLGIFTGFLAYYLAENNPRTAPPTGEGLLDLIRWKREKWAGQRTKVESESERKSDGKE